MSEEEAIANMISSYRRDGMMYPLYVNLENTNVFTLFFPSLNPDRSNHILLYNPGGPGSSGIPSLFDEFLPYYVQENNGQYEIVENPLGKILLTNFSILYIDIGGDTGYNIVNQDQVWGDDVIMTETLQVIKKVLEVYQDKIGSNPILSFFGFSYAGKLWPMVATKCIQENIQVDNIVIFSGYTHPIYQEIKPISEYLLYSGIISQTEYEDLETRTLDLENRINKNYESDWRNIQKDYIDLLDEMWSKVQVDEYNIYLSSKRKKKYVDEYTEEIYNSDVVKKSLGVYSDYADSATVFDVETYKGFLLDAGKDLLFLSQNGVTIVYVKGMQDGATIIKGTQDMFEAIFGRKIVYEPWIVNIFDEEITIGRIAEIVPNVFLCTVIGTGHNFDTEFGYLSLYEVLTNLL